MCTVDMVKLSGKSLSHLYHERKTGKWIFEPCGSWLDGNFRFIYSYFEC